MKRLIFRSFEKLFLHKTRIYVYETLCSNRCEPSIEALNLGGGVFGGRGESGQM